MVPVTSMQILGGASVGLGVLYKVFTAWTSSTGLAAFKAFYLGNFALNFGAQHWVSLVAGPAITSVGCLMSYLIKYPMGSLETPQMIQACVLGSNVSMALLNLLVFGPKSSKTMFKRHEHEVKAGVGHEVGMHVDRTELLKDPEYAAVDKQFRKLHAASMICNLSSMVGNYLHLWHLASNGL